MEKKRTIIICHNYNYETFANMSLQLAHYLSNRNFRVIFISHKPKLDFFIDQFGVEVYSWPSKNRPTTFKDFIFFVKIFMKYKPGTVISHFGAVNITAIVSKVFSIGKTKFYPYYHTLSSQLKLDQASQNRYWLKILKYRKQLLYKLFSTKIICPSSFAVIDLKKHFGVDNGIKVLNPMSDRFAEYEKEYNKNSITISYLGRIEKSKGILEFIDVFIKLTNQEDVNKRITLNIAGFGGKVEELKTKIKNHHHINYIGKVEYDQVDEYIRNSDFIIITSKYDNLPTVGIESLMNTTPLLISQNTGLTEELEDGFNCIKFTPDANGYKYVVEKIINGDLNYNLLKQNSRKIFLEKFTIEKYCETMYQLIK